MRRFLSPSLLPLLIGVVWILFSARESAAQRPSMELLDTKQSASQTSIDIAGQVKNISPREVSGVTVYCNFQDAGGKSVRMEQAALATDPLAPNKISQFKCSTKSSPEIKRFNVTFAEMFGGPLATKDSRKK